MNRFIDIVNVCKSYAEAGAQRKILQSVHVQIARGEFVALIGRSGSGKSTLLNLISGIDAPDSGRISIDGQELTGLNERARTLFRRKQIGFIFQFFNLVPTLTVLENLLLPLELNRVDATTGRARALDLLHEVGLADRQHVYPDRLSGGEQQRIAIARALVHDPALVLADEPTGNLDTDTGVQVLDLLDRLTRQAGKTLLVVTHSADVAALADRVLRVVDGRLVEESVVAHDRAA